MTRSKNNGFSVVEIVLVVVIVALFAFVGWWVYKARSDKKDATTPTANTNVVQPSATPSSPEKSVTPEPAKDSTAGWLQYDAPQYKVAFADGWNVTKKESSQGSFFALNNSDLKYKAGQKAVVNEYRAADANEGGLRFIMDYNTAGASPSDCQGVKQSYKTADGNDVYAESTTTVSKKTFTYCVQLGKAELYVTYVLPSGEEDHSAVVEQVVKTVVAK